MENVTLGVNWSLLLIVILVLTVIAVVGAMAIYYIRHWAARQQSNPVQAGTGKYFQQYIPEEIALKQQSLSVQQHQQKLSRITFQRKLVTALLVAIFTLGVGTGLYVNRDKLAARIDLTEAEKANLVMTHHEWQKLHPEQLPVLAQQLASLRQKGFVLLGDAIAEESSPQTSFSRQQRKASTTWQDFATAHHIQTTTCSWQDLPECQQVYQGWVFVVLPDFWQARKLDNLLQSGASVILYDAPFQVAKKGHYALYDLSFQRQIDHTASVLSLVADKELTLGFDAGSILDVQSASHNYAVTSNQPQAIAIDPSRVAGGTVRTRLYAQALNRGRLVWMDFSPNVEDHTAELEPERFNPLIASIFRYLNKTPYQGIATWPQGKQFAAIMEEDTEDMFQNAERVRAFFAEHHYPITWYMLSNEAQINRDLTRKLGEMGEVACHGDNHHPFSLSSTSLQHERMARCRKVIAEITGKQVFTFRPPEEKFNGSTLDAMLNTGITHYIAENGVDRFVPVIMKSTVNGKELVSIPRMVTDDFLLWDGMKADAATTQQLLEQEVQYVEKLGGLYMFSFHTQFMQDDEKFAAIKYLANRLDQKQAYFQTAGMISRWWKIRSRLIAGLPVNTADIELFKPVMLKVGSTGKVSGYAWQPHNNTSLISKADNHAK